jgi:hypothetical protein
MEVVCIPLIISNIKTSLRLVPHDELTWTPVLDPEANHKTIFAGSAPLEFIRQSEKNVWNQIRSFASFINTDESGVCGASR